jgi:hypothetical protein
LPAGARTSALVDEKLAALIAAAALENILS